MLKLGPGLLVAVSGVSAVVRTGSPDDQNRFAPPKLPPGTDLPNRSAVVVASATAPAYPSSAYAYPSRPARSVAPNPGTSYSAASALGVAVPASARGLTSVYIVDRAGVE